jgi:hypothetical protein
MNLPTLSVSREGGRWRFAARWEVAGSEGPYFTTSAAADFWASLTQFLRAVWVSERFRCRQGRHWLPVAAWLNPSAYTPITDPLIRRTSPPCSGE